MATKLKGAGTTPPWVRRLHLATRPGRAIDWIEKYVVVPSGRNSGDPLHLHPFQRELIEILLDPAETTGGFQIGAGNSKSTTAAALGLWALCDAEDAPQVVLLASSGLQATRTLFTPMRHMIANSLLNDFIKIRRDNTQRGFETDFNDGSSWIMPADDARLQGLNPSLALVDEAEFVSFDVLQALEDRLGKRTEQLLLAFGTPGPDEDCVLHHVRTQAAEGGPYAWTEYAAPPDLDIRSPATWRLANPGLDAGILGIEAFERDMAAIDAAKDNSTRLRREARFRMFRLGQWMAGYIEDSWLPAGAWAACPTAAPPDDGAKIVLAVDGTYRRSTAVVAATLEEPNSVFLLYAGEGVTDDEVEGVIAEACERWDVVEIPYYHSIRAELIARLDRRGLPVNAWSLKREDENRCTNSLWAAIAEGRLVHDGSPLLAEHMGNVGYRDGPSGIVLKRLNADGKYIDGAMALRMCWWKALDINRLQPSVW